MNYNMIQPPKIIRFACGCIQVLTIYNIEGTETSVRNKKLCPMHNNRNGNKKYIMYDDCY